MEMHLQVRENVVNRNKATTFKGLVIDIVTHHDIEATNRGWIIDLFEARKDKELIGYLKVAYIPHENQEKFYPKGSHLAHFASAIGGWVGLPKNYSEAEFIEHVRRYSQYPLTTKAEAEAVLRKRFTREWREFCEWNIDKPKIDYAKVDPAWQRQGIATTLYAEALQFYHKQGLPLFASTLQSKPAKALWASIEQNGGTFKLHNYRRRVGTQVRRELLTLTPIKMNPQATLQTSQPVEMD